MGKNINLLGLFSQLDCQSSIRRLVEITYRIALVYLRYNHRKFSRIFSESELTFEEAAISAITPLFCKDLAEQVLPIIKEFNSWQPSIKTEDDALYFLNKIISSRVEQHISHLFKEQDPFFAKILDSVNYLIKKDGYKRVSYLGKKYIIRSDEERINGKTIDYDSFDQLPGHLFKNRKTMLAEVFNYLDNETNFLPAIPLNSLVLRLRQFNTPTQVIQFNTNGADTDFDVEEIVKFGVNSALSKLRDSYYSKGKLTDSERKYFEKTIQHIANDLRDGGVNRGLCAYLTFYMPDLEKQVYEDKYHNILEYLVKVMKNKIRERLIENKK